MSKGRRATAFSPFSVFCLHFRMFQPSHVFRPFLFCFFFYEPRTFTHRLSAEADRRDGLQTFLNRHSSIVNRKFSLRFWAAVKPQEKSFGADAQTYLEEGRGSFSTSPPMADVKTALTFYIILCALCELCG